MRSLTPDPSPLERGGRGKNCQLSIIRSALVTLLQRPQAD